MSTTVKRIARMFGTETFLVKSESKDAGIIRTYATNELFNAVDVVNKVNLGDFKTKAEAVRAIVESI